MIHVGTFVNLIMQEWVVVRAFVTHVQGGLVGVKKIALRSLRTSAELPSCVAESVFVHRCVVGT